MGVDFADPDHDGDQDALVTNFSGQPNGYYENRGSLGFSFQSAASGLGEPSIPMLGFGCNWLDFDGDGWEDLYVANGHVNDNIEQSVPGITYAQRASLYRNGKNGRFAELPPQAGRGPWRERVSRGSALLDFNRDGAVDILVANCGDQAELLQNRQSPGKRWLTLVLEGRRSNRSAVGARVQVVTAETVQTREVRAGSSYMSQSELAQTFALGSADAAQEVRVRWPSGKTTTLKSVTGGQVLRVVEPT